MLSTKRIKLALSFGVCFPDETRKTFAFSFGVCSPDETRKTFAFSFGVCSPDETHKSFAFSFGEGGSASDCEPRRKGTINQIIRFFVVSR